MSLNLPRIKSGGIIATIQSEFFRPGNDPALYVPLDAISAASGAGSATATGTSVGHGYALSYGYGSASATGTAVGEGLAPVIVTSGAGSASAVGAATAEGYALASGNGEASASGSALGAGATTVVDVEMLVGDGYGLTYSQHKRLLSLIKKKDACRNPSASLSRPHTTPCPKKCRSRLRSRRRPCSWTQTGNAGASTRACPSASARPWLRLSRRTCDSNSRTRMILS